jgi:hypothetical protein
LEELTCQTLESWSRSRRVVGNAEHLPGKANPRFVVTSYAVERLAAAPALFSCFAEPPKGSLKPQKALASGGNSHKHANKRRSLADPGTARSIAVPDSNIGALGGARRLRRRQN